MAQKFWGSINLDAIKEAIQGGVKPYEGKKGKYLEVNVWVNDEDDQFGNRCSIQVYNKDTKQATYLGNLKLSQFENNQQQVQASAQAQNVANEPDLPF